MSDRVGIWLFTVVCGLQLLQAPTQGQPTTSPPQWEFKAVSFGIDEKENTKKLNDLAADGWEYVGPIGNSMVAFKRSHAARLARTEESKASEVRRVLATGKSVWSLDASPDGKHCVAAVADPGLNGMRVQHFDLATGQLVRDLSEESGEYVVRFANDGKWIVQANYSGRIKIVETATGKEIRRIQTDAPLWNTVVMGGGKYALVISAKFAQVYNLDTGKEVQRWKFEQGKFLWTSSVDGKFFYYTVDGTLPFLTLNLDTGKEEQLLPKALMDKKSFSFQPGGRHVVSEASISTVYDTATGKELRRLDISKYGKDSVNFGLTHDWHRVLVSYKDRSVALWDTGTNKELCRFTIDGDIREWAISPNARHAVASTTTGTLYFWRLPEVSGAPQTPGSKK